MNITQFIVPVVTGIATGMITYLTASGMSLIISGMGTINFGQGSFYILGALVSYMLTKAGSFPLAIGLGFFIPFLVGALVEVSLRPVAGKDMMFTVMITMGLTYIMQDMMELYWGGLPKTSTVPQALKKILRVGDVFIPSYYVFIIVFSAVVALAIWVIFEKTRLGITFRAIIDDRPMVESLGINVGRMFTLMFMIGIGLGGLAGALNIPISGTAPQYAMSVFSNVIPVLIVGGMRNMKGALPAALLLGLLQGVAAVLTPRFYNIVPYVFMVICLFIKPNGIFTKEGA